MKLVAAAGERERQRREGQDAAPMAEMDILIEKSFGQ